MTANSERKKSLIKAYCEMFLTDEEAIILKERPGRVTSDALEQALDHGIEIRLPFIEKTRKEEVIIKTPLPTTLPSYINPTMLKLACSLDHNIVMNIILEKVGCSHSQLIEAWPELSKKLIIILNKAFPNGIEEGCSNVDTLAKRLISTGEECVAVYTLLKH